MYMKEGKLKINIEITMHYTYNKLFINCIIQL